VTKSRIAVAGAGYIDLANLRVTEAIAEAARTGRAVETGAH
jgi:hypothetical protein